MLADLQLSTTDWIVGGFFIYIAILGAFRPLAFGQRVRVLLIALACIGAAALLAAEPPWPAPITSSNARLVSATTRPLLSRSCRRDAVAPFVPSFRSIAGLAPALETAGRRTGVAAPWKEKRRGSLPNPACYY
ncbi:MAG: hypothetical protein QGG24_04500 [Vicinamibacterales bacterium]|nr:hypothetical protein [Acidobacteriota bacterium]MDP7294560.1 hypothetical protein [Vicinamibacterales bacterium]MDP7470836.1 hypothetical protein [Vicinamibacterales bacterium]MDP7672421.1 hypothetical protein [Vicinamibacterales bacterium]HJO37479.1 hypothetical protein [Vicinamibacterales bacterium]